MEDEKTVAKPGRRKKAVDGTGARASPKTQETKTSEIANQDKHESKPDLEVAEQVVLLPLNKLQPFKDHLFKVKDDDELMQDTIDSIMVGGVINPILVRPAQNGGFEVVSGHRRFRASQLAGLNKTKAIVREMDDDTAIITMVDSNLQRENILPSERAFSYKMKLEALRHQGKRPDLGEQSTSPQLGEKSSWAVSVVAEDAGSSRSQIQRFIRLTNLIPQLMEMVDNKELAFNPAVELSWLKPQEQKDFLEAMDYGQATPSLSQAQRIKKLSQAGQCSLEVMCAIMNEEKKSDLDRVTLKSDVLRKYFPKSYTPLQMQQTIIKLLESWQKNQKRDKTR